MKQEMVEGELMKRKAAADDEKERQRLANIAEQKRL